MTTQPDGLAATPAGESAASTSDDGIIELDAPGQAEEPVSDIEDGKLNTEDPKPEDTPDAAAEEKDAEKKKLSGAQRAKIREQRLLDEIAARDRELETLRKGPATPAATADGKDPKAPKEEDFNGDYLAFTQATAVYNSAKAAREAVRDEFKGREDAERTREAAKAAQQRRLDHAERVETAKEVIADFDQVMEGMKGVNVRDELIEEIMSSPSSAIVTYHLAKNPDVLEAMNRMSPRELAKEMGRLEATLKMPEPKKTTSAPPPLTQRKGGASPGRSQEQVLSSWLDKTYGKDRH